MNEREFKLFYEAHATSLWAYVRRITNDAALSDDVVQESFLRFLNHSGTELSELQKKSYVFRTATNLVYDHWRRNKKIVSWNETDEMTGVHSPDSSTKMDFDKAFQELSEQNRSLLWLAYAQDYTHEEIGAILKIKTGSVKVLLFRAKNRLMEVFKQLNITGDK